MLKQRESISVSYFAEFLLQIGHIISNIRRYVHQIITISVPKMKEEPIKESISSIILATNKTFGELKEIQSLIAGYVKAQRLKLSKRSISESNSTAHQSERSKKSRYAKEWYNQTTFQQQFFSGKGNRSRGKNREEVNGRKSIKHSLLEDYDPKPQKNESNTQQRTNVHIYADKSYRWLIRLQSLWGNIIEANRKSLQKIIDKNKQCRDELHMLRSQIMRTY